MLTSDCGSDVSEGAERDRLWDWNRFACHCLNIASSSRIEGEGGTRVFGTVDGIGGQILQEPESMEQVQEDVDGNTRSGGGAQR